MTINRQDYLTPNQAGQRLGVSGQTVRRWIETGLLPAVQLPNGRYLIHKTDAVTRQAKPSK